MAEATEVRPGSAARSRSGGAARGASIRARLLPILVAGLVVRLLLAPVGGLEGDLDVVRAWAERLTTLPLSSFYDTAQIADHLPGDLWILWAIAHLHRLVFPAGDFGTASFLFLIKLVPILADLGIAMLLFLVGRRLGGERLGLFAAGAWALNPAPIFLASIWGQWDSVSACVALAALWCYLAASPRGWSGPEWALPLLAYATLIKPQFAALVPLFGFAYALRFVLPHTRWARFSGGREAEGALGQSLRRLAAASAAALAMALAVLLPFGVGLPGMPTRWSIVERLSYAADVYKFTTLNAFNLWALPIAGNWKPDDGPFLAGLTYQAWGTLLFAAAYLLVLWRVYRRRGDDVLVWACLAVTFSAFMLPTRSHERYLFPAVVFAIALAAAVPRLRWVAAALSATYLLNLYWVYDLYAPALDLRWLYREPNWVLYAASALNVALLAYVLLSALRVRTAPAAADGASGAREVAATPARSRSSVRRAGRGTAGSARPSAVAPVDAAPERAPVDRLRYALPALLFAGALLLFAPRLGTANQYIYDEVYHAYTGAQYVEGNADAYVWDTKPPREGVSYEWTHPPLGKLLIADGILVFGDNPTGWRIASVVFGAGGVALAYFLGWRATRRRGVALLAAGLLLADGLYFVQSRTSMLDIFGLVFMTGALLAFLGYLHAPPGGARWPLLRTGLLMGLAIATKWNAVYASALIGLVALWKLWGYRRLSVGESKQTREEGRVGLREHLVWVPVGLILLPLGVYLLSYTPFFLTGHTPSQFVELQRQMLYYHTHLEATHDYQSSWWSWPLALRPVWYWVGREGETVANIYAQPNPLLYWAFVPAVGWTAYRWWGTKRPEAVVLLIGFFGQWLPWALSPRLAYVYHFLPAVPFGCLAVAVVVSELWRERGRLRWAAGGYVAAVVAAFLFFYPLYAGLPLTQAEFDLRIWFESWR